MSRRQHHYSVQDVIDAVQDGESDVEIEFDGETDEDSDEEPCGELDEENQPPADCPANADIEPRLATYAKPRERYRGQKKYFTSPNTDFSGPPPTEDVTSLRAPLEYFRQFVSKDMIQSLVTNTNEYSRQTKGTSVNTNTKEIEKMLGMYLRMGLVQMDACRMYWETETRYPPVADVMPRNRFQSMLTSLHLVNNLTVSETEKKDKLWKIRPWFDSFREKGLQVVPEEHDSVDKTHIEVERPYIVGNYNQDTGGVDLLDSSFTAKYKYRLKSRRWYTYFFWHTITLAVVNAWLLYKRDCQALKEKPELNLRRFQAQLAASLILVDTVKQTPKRGRPSSDNGSPVTGKRPSSGATSAPHKRSCGHLPLDVRQDQIGHLPMKTTRGRCRHCPNGYTTTQCRKCDVRLCFSDVKNCFSDFHCK